MENVTTDIYEITNFVTKELDKERKNGVLSRHILERWLDFYSLSDVEQKILYVDTREHLKKIGWVG